MGGFEVTVENAVTMPKMDVLVGFDGVPEICWKKKQRKSFKKFNQVIVAYPGYTGTTLLVQTMDNQ